MCVGVGVGANSGPDSQLAVEDEFLRQCLRITQYECVCVSMSFSIIAYSHYYLSSYAVLLVLVLVLVLVL